MMLNKRSYHHNIKVQRKAASDNVDTVASQPEDLAKKTNECDYTKQPIFNVDKTVFYWKKMLSRALKAREEK